MTTRTGPAQMAEVLTVQSSEVLRAWRMARNTSFPDVLPGLCDGLLASFFDLLGPMLARGAAPAEVVPALSGILRLPDEGGPERIEEEWQVARQLLRGFCGTLGASKVVESWLDDAAAAGQDAAVRTARGEAGALPGVVVVRVHSGSLLRPRG